MGPYSLCVRGHHLTSKQQYLYGEVWRRHTRGATAFMGGSNYATPFMPSTKNSIYATPAIVEGITGTLFCRGNEQSRLSIFGSYEKLAIRTLHRDVPTPSGKVRVFSYV